MKQFEKLIKLVKKIYAGKTFLFSFQHEKVNHSGILLLRHLKKKNCGVGVPKLDSRTKIAQN